MSSRQLEWLLGGGAEHVESSAELCEDAVETGPLHAAVIEHNASSLTNAFN